MVSNFNFMDLMAWFGVASVLPTYSARIDRKCQLRFEPHALKVVMLSVFFYLLMCYRVGGESSIAAYVVIVLFAQIPGLIVAIVLAKTSLACARLVGICIVVLPIISSAYIWVAHM
jgi:hypothetical protein